MPAALCGVIALFCAVQAWAIEIPEGSGGGPNAVEGTISSIAYVIWFSAALLAGGSSLVLGAISVSVLGLAVTGLALGGLLSRR